MRPDPTLAVALHDVEPATFERCVEVREWLEDRGVDRVTLLVIPARDLHPLGERSPELAGWLAERRRRGDSIAQHGFQHEQLRCARWTRRLPTPVRSRRAAEFAGLDRDEARRAVEAGWRLLKLAGVEPDGFVAPAYAYTPALRRVLSPRFRWWADAVGLYGGPDRGGPGHGGPDRGETGPGADHGETDRAWRRLAPAWGPTSAGVGSLLARGTLRLDLSPTCLLRRRHLRALEAVLGRAGERRLAVTYDDLVATARGAATRRDRLTGTQLGAPLRCAKLAGTTPGAHAAAPRYSSTSGDASAVLAPSNAVAAPSSAVAAALRHGRA